MLSDKQIITTADGSLSIAVNEWNEHYHSVHGALQESQHVYINNGLNDFTGQQTVTVLEFGFGTGLNALLTYLWAEKQNITVFYHTIEAFPLKLNLVSQLNYSDLLQTDKSLFLEMHKSPFGKKEKLLPNFYLHKINETFENYQPQPEFADIIFFDVFGARVQPHLWGKTILKKAEKALKPQGVFVTYSAKGQVKRDLKSLGFTVYTPAGPPGKREMIKAVKHVEK